MKGWRTSPVFLHLWPHPTIRKALGTALLGSWIWLGMLLVGQFEVVKRYADVPRYTDAPIYKRVALWLESAECARTRHVILAVCGANGAIAPIEDVLGADDQGHALLAEVAAVMRSRPATKLTLTRLNLLLNTGALVLVSGLLFLAGCRFAAVLSVWAGIPWGIPGPYAGADAFAALFAVYCFASVPAFVAVRTLTGPVSARRLVLGCIASAVAVAGAIVLRESIGLAGLLAAIGLIVAQLISERLTVRRAVVGASLILTLLSATQVTSAMFTLRSALFGIAPGRLVGSHGLSHALYLGLGTHPNPWGIKWEDEEAANAVARVDPAAALLSPRYFKVLWGLYFDALRRHPSAAVKIYWQKAAETLRFDKVGQKLLITVVLGVVACWAGARELRLLLYTAGGMLALTALTLLQGVLAVPAAQFFYPAAFGANVLLFIIADIVWHAVAQWRSRPAGECALIGPASAEKPRV